MKKTFCVVQVNHQQGPRKFNNFYLPYTAGVLSAFALADLEVESKWKLHRLIWRRDPIEQVAQELKHLDVVALSVYVWNKSWTYALGKRLKELNPQQIIVAGGPEIAIHKDSLFEQHPWMDYVVCLEGEYAFRRLLKQDFKNAEDIPGLIINVDNKLVHTDDPIRMNDLSEVPSPYLLGYFDDIVKENPECTWSATLETTRGCPYQCTFCDWGSLTYSKVKKFGLERTYEELDWIGKHCEHVFFTDANFGMFYERDDLIVDKLLEVQDKYNVIKTHTMTWAKNQNKAVISLAKKLMDHKGVRQALSVSIQSTTTDVLEKIKRKNLATNKVQEVFDLCEREGIPVESELILGLPGETAESWKNTFYDMFKLGNHYGVSYYFCQLLENAEMVLSQTEEYNIQGRPVYDYIQNVEADEDVDESLILVVGTDTIDPESMLDLWVWTSVLRALHIGGLTTYIARFLYKKYSIEYKDFYHNLIEFLQQDHWWAKEIAETKKYYEQWINNGRITHYPIDNQNIFWGWNLFMRLQVMVHYQNKFDHTFDLVKSFIEEHYACEETVELLEFQKQTIITFHNQDQYPMTLESPKDYYGYIVDDSPLHNKAQYTLTNTAPLIDDTGTFYSNFWYRRKAYFGNATVHKHN